MIFIYIFFNEIFFNKTALTLAVQKEDIESIKLLLNNQLIDVNIPYISKS